MPRCRRCDGFPQSASESRSSAASVASAASAHSVVGVAGPGGSSATAEGPLEHKLQWPFVVRVPARGVSPRYRKARVQRASVRRTLARFEPAMGLLSLDKGSPPVLTGWRAGGTPLCNNLMRVQRVSRPCRIGPGAATSHVHAGSGWSSRLTRFLPLVRRSAPAMARYHARCRAVTLLATRHPPEPALGPATAIAGVAPTDDRPTPTPRPA